MCRIDGWKRYLFAAALVGLCARYGHSADPATWARVGAQLTPETLGVVQLSLGQVRWEEVQGQLTVRLQEALEKLKEQHQKLLEAGATDVIFLIDPEALSGEQPTIIVACRSPQDAQSVRDLLASPAITFPVRLGEAVIRGNLVIAGGINRGPTDDQRQEQLVQALEAGQQAVVRLVLLPSPMQRRVLAGTVQRLGGMVGGKEAPLADVRWMTLAIPLAPEAHLTWVLAATDAQHAQDVKRALDAMVEYARQQQPFPPSLKPEVDAVIDAVRIQVEEDRVIVRFDNPTGASPHPVMQLAASALASMHGGEKGRVDLIGALSAAQQAAERREHVNNLKQIGLAIYNFEDTYGGFPPAASYDSQGRPLLSWRVFLLPYLDQNELYSQFHLDEPWDSPHNRQLIEQMPKAFGSGPEPGKTTYLAVVGEDTIIAQRKGTTIAEITDGTSKTLMVVQAPSQRAVEWTRPVDLTVGDEAWLTKLLSEYSGPFSVLFADASVHQLPSDLDHGDLRALMTKSGKEPTELP